MTTFHMTRTALLEDAFTHATDTQREKLAKMLNMGWTLSSVDWTRGTDQIALGMTTKEQGAWLLPDGTLVRPKDGRTTAYVNLKKMRAA